MNHFVLNLVLAVFWALFHGTLTLPSLTIGFVIGYCVLGLVQPMLGGRSPYFRRSYTWTRLFVMFHYELFVSSIAVVWEVITPTQKSRPNIIEMPLDVKSDIGIFFVTNLISLTPGTLSLDVSDDRKTLLVHAMFAEDPEALVKSLKDGMERWVMEALEK